MQRLERPRATLPSCCWPTQGSERGAAFLLIVYLSLLLLLLLNGIFLRQSMVEMHAAERARDREQAFWVAEAGLDALITENRRANWTFLTQNANGTAASPAPSPTVAGATIDGAGIYRLTVGTQNASARSLPDPTGSSLVRIESSGASNNWQGKVVGLFQNSGPSLLDYVFLTPGPANLRSNQRITILGGSSRFVVDGDLTIYTGYLTADPSFKTVRLEAGSVNINGAIIRNTESVTSGGPVYFRNTGTGQDKEVPCISTTIPTRRFTRRTTPASIRCG